MLTRFNHSILGEEIVVSVSLRNGTLFVLVQSPRTPYKYGEESKLVGDSIQDESSMVSAAKALINSAFNQYLGGAQ